MTEVFEQLTQSYLNKIINKSNFAGGGERSYYPAVEELFNNIFETLEGEYKITIEKKLESEIGSKTSDDPGRKSVLTHDSNKNITSETPNSDKKTYLGIPDFTITKGWCDVGIIEAKDIDKDLDDVIFQDQFKKYINSKDNALITNFLEWRWYYKQNEVKRIKLGEFVAETDSSGEKNIKPLKQNFDDFNQIITEFLSHKTEITNSDVLSYRMAQQARLLRDEILKMFDKPNSGVIKHELKTIQENLKKDTTKEEFANIKAQMTIYGVFIAKLYYGDKNKEDFKFERIVENIPASNSFLQQLFYTQNNPFYMEETTRIIIDRSIEMMAETDVVRILDDFAKKNKTSTAIVEFYETFLEKYDPKLRADLGVWYTPQPIVDFMVRQIDLILINTFGIKDGIINTDEVAYNKDNKQDKLGNPTQTQQQVQVLDPATGTGTFLVEYIRLAFEKFMKTGRYSEWNNYVEKYLLKNLNAFEIMMCPYVLAHLQIDIILQQFGTNASNFISNYIENNNIFPNQEDKKLLLEGFIWKRFCKKDNINEAIEKYSGYHIADKNNNKLKANIFLTNSLDDWNDPKDTSTKDLFGDIIEREGTEARKIKKQKHIMVVMGNPPYNASTMNKGKWITSLLDDYKYEKDKNGKKTNLLEGEKNIKPLSDDYVKFIRYGENYIEKNDRGILSFITNNSYLDGCTHRGMRKHLLKTFDDIYIFNLHGDARRDKDLMKNNNDQNPFNIMQGVAISIFVKKPHDEDEYIAKQNNTTYTKPLATVHYKDLSGSRFDKFRWLDEHNIFSQFNSQSANSRQSQSSLQNELETLNRDTLTQPQVAWAPQGAVDSLCQDVSTNKRSRSLEQNSSSRFDLDGHDVFGGQSSNASQSAGFQQGRPASQAALAALNDTDLTPPQAAGALGGAIEAWINNKHQIQFDREWIPEERENYLFKPKDRTGEEEWLKMFNIKDLFLISNVGCLSKKDDLTVKFEKEKIENIVNDFKLLEETKIKEKYNIQAENCWSIKSAKKDLIKNKNYIMKYSYRVFDDRWTCYTGYKGFCCCPSGNTMRQFINQKNIFIIASKIYSIDCFIVNKLVDMHFSCGGDSIFPLYIFSSTDTRQVNFSQQLINTFTSKLSIPFIESNPDNDQFAGFKNGMRVSGFWNRYTDKTKFNELHLFDYIYGVLNDKEYRNKYKVFLEMDFPRVPYPESVDEFFEYSKRGEILRHLHLMEIADVERYCCIDFTAGKEKYKLKETKKDRTINDTENKRIVKETGTDSIDKIKTETNNIDKVETGTNTNNIEKVKFITNSDGTSYVYINKTQYFHIPTWTLEYQIGSYHPVREYLKKREGRVLTDEENDHFAKIVRVVEESEKYINTHSGDIGLSSKDKYKQGTSAKEIFKTGSMGFSSGKDEIIVHFSKSEAQNIATDFVTLDKDDLKLKYNASENIDWNFDTFIDTIKNHKYDLIDGSYRAFDDRTIIYSTKVGAFARSRNEVMQHLIKNNNVTMLISRFNGDIFISNKLTCMDVISNRSYVYPLYTFSKTGNREHNFSQQLINTFTSKLSIPFIESNPDSDPFAGFKNGMRVDGFWNRYTDKTKFNELHLFDYIYGVLNDKEYRNKYKVFLEMDFPRVPYPESVEAFFETAKKGEILRHLHLMEIADVEKFECVDFESLSISYNEIDKDTDNSKPSKQACILEGKHQALEHQNRIENVKMEQVENLNINCCFDKCGLDKYYQQQAINSNQSNKTTSLEVNKQLPACRIWINKYQYFVIPEHLWMFQIGSYKPVQEYLKKRKDRILTEEEQRHFERMCKVCLMSEVVSKKSK